MAIHYGSDYDKAISSAGEGLAAGQWAEPVESLLRRKSQGAILDLGCSSGGFLTSMKGPSWKLYGIEMSKPVADRARAATGAEVFVGDVLDAPFEAGTFDAITCFHVFEHVYRPREVLQKILTWLKPGGVFIAYMPNIDSGAARCFRSYWYALELPRHLSHFSPKSLSKLAKSVGFSNVTITTHREPFVETSVRYVIEDMMSKLGIVLSPCSAGKTASLPWRVIRKGFRLTALPVLNQMFGMAGPGEIIHAVLQKEDSRSIQQRSISG